MPGRPPPSGKLRHRVEVQVAGETKDALGETIQVWTTQNSRWCSIEPFSGSEPILADQATALVSHKVVMRYYPGLTAKMRFRRVLRVFNIVDVLVHDEIVNVSECLVTEVWPYLHFLIVAPASAANGSPVNVTVSCLDQGGNLAVNYTGTAHFTSTDGLSIVPGDYTFTSGDAGVHVFSVTFGTNGNQTVTATDVSTQADQSIAGTSNPVNVSGSYQPGLRFNDPRNSMYLPVIG